VAPHQVPCVQYECQGEEGTIDAGDIRGKPSRQKDVSDGPASSSQVLRQSSQRTAESVPRVNESLSGRDSGRDCRSAVRLASQPGVDEITDGGLDHEEGEGVHGLDTNQCRSPSPAWKIYDSQVIPPTGLRPNSVLPGPPVSAPRLSTRRALPFTANASTAGGPRPPPPSSPASCSSNPGTH